MEEKKCWECNGTYKVKEVDYSLYGISLGKFKAKVCSKCNDTVFSEEASKEIEKIAKDKGLFGLESRTKVGKVGNSLDVKINNKIASFVNIKKGEEVIVYPESKKKIIVEIV